jgi:peptidoglycan/LPS O-acetylase OafA/YrhL
VADAELLSGAPERVSGEPNVAKSKPSMYIPALDGIRGIAFLLVFVSHAGLDRIVPGGFGVTVFFFLSGYLITTLLRMEAAKTGTISLKKFYIRRARRILGPLYITLALSYVVAHFGLLAVRGTFQGALSAVFYYFNYFELLTHVVPLPAGVGVVWSLTIEEHFYFVFPFLYWIFIVKKIRVRTQTLILLLLCALPLIWRFVLVFGFHTPLETLPRWTYSATDARFDAILWGCILAIANNPWLGEERPTHFLLKYKGTAASTGVLLLLTTFLWRNPYFRETARYSIQSIALYSVFFYCVQARESWVSKALENRFLKEIGHLSYSMYLVHFMILNLLAYNLHFGLFVQGCIAFTCTVLYALAMRAFVEDPLRRAIRA